MSLSITSPQGGINGSTPCQKWRHTPESLCNEGWRCLSCMFYGLYPVDYIINYICHRKEWIISCTLLTVLKASLILTRPSLSVRSCGVHRWNTTLKKWARTTSWRMKTSSSSLKSKLTKVWTRCMARVSNARNCSLHLQTYPREHLCHVVSRFCCNLTNKTTWMCHI